MTTPPATRAAALRYAGAPRAGSLNGFPPLPWTLEHVATTLARWLLQDRMPDQHVLFAGLPSSAVMDDISPITLVPSPGHAAVEVEDAAFAARTAAPKVLVAIADPPPSTASFGEFGWMLPGDRIEVRLESGESRRSDQPVVLLGSISPEQARHLETRLAEAGGPCGRILIEHLEAALDATAPSPGLASTAIAHPSPAP